MNIKKQVFLNFPMGKKIILGMLVLLVSIGMVNAELGEELVTCGDFTCDTNWNGLTYVDDDNDWFYFDAADAALLNGGISSSNNGSFDQSLNIDVGSTYNVSIFVLTNVGAPRISLRLSPDLFQ